MIRRLFSFIVVSLATASAVAADIDYAKGVIFINEDWYGHQNSTVNYLLPDDPGGEYWHYRVIQSENPGVELGCTNQYGAIWDGRLYMIAKQDKDPGASVVGGRVTVADASTMKVIKQLQLIDPSGAQCDGRAFVGVTDKKGYVSSSNGMWILNLETLEIEGQVKGSANPNAGGDNDKPNSDPTSSLYFGQTGTMVLAEGRVFAVHQQYGLLVVDPEKDEVVETLTMDIVDDAIEADTGTRPRRTSGIGSSIVRSKDGYLWHSVAKNVQGTGAAVPYIVRVDPKTLDRKVIAVAGDDIFPPTNSWYAWTPDPFCASSVTNRLYWCGGQNSWFTNYRVFRYDIDTGKVEKIIDFNEQDGDWHVYGCSLGIHPETDELYASLFHKFVDPTYVTRRFDADGNMLKDYPMISNYWFPSLPVFPQAAGCSSGVDDVAADEDVSVEYYDLYGRRLGPDSQGYRGIVIRRTGSRTEKLIL
ncbi:MAG: DUF5074 domain-containing protein [Bacteroides sp.]|nr:DUF5074 domain-containing protein [Bacteroides sp.]MCM1458445.1 DUF5074 domain-containing protein [Lachnoclostridium sp.]